MATYTNFGAETTATEVAAAFAEQIQGKHVLLVGVSPGTVEINLASQASIRKAAEEIKALTPKLDVIINNAGINVLTHEYTAEGIELHFGTNHIGLFLLTNLLLKAFPKPRVVNLTSAGHRLSPIRFSDYNFTKKDVPEAEQPPPGLPAQFFEGGGAYSGFVAYGQSKTANILFSVSLQRRGIASYAVHPGSIWTGLSRNLDEKGLGVIKGTATTWKNGDQGAATALVAAFDPGLDGTKGNEVYMADCQLAEAAPHAVDAEMAERLWGLSEELVGEKFALSG
ncbi:Short-chain dehydrogenase TIC 32-chloroplastic-like protein [Lachnellula suecica]|uniref:Short-chain dehydrogenase TIC 32-chloroplastic-like protein n=1 Tax=Lachnellula suecica TaxID=602035 RepID=A0A8T9C2H5_9HELO|nr:Short-chain dehydrogenase TIC 32-chloroplastic-like protein [Lachnellula suecica]